MKFNSLQELVNNINNKLGTFCEEFQYKRKKLLKLGRVFKKNILFIYNSNNNRDWAINPGGGTELQYHLFFRDNEIGYGLGFNSKYVPFKNSKGTVEYIKPFVQSFLSQKELESNLINKGLNYIYGNQDELKNLLADKYILIGKKIQIENQNGIFNVDDKDFNSMLDDIKGTLFDTYKKVFSKIQLNNIQSLEIMQIIDVLKQKKQLILQGPPGTGKTYTAKNIAEQLITGKISDNKKEQKQILEDSKQFKLIQFHPAYTYEDFVRSITAKSAGKYIEYITENKTIAKIASEANQNYLATKKDPEELSKEEKIKELIAEFAEKIQEKIADDEKFKITNSVSIIDVEEDAFRYDNYENNWNVSRRMKFDDLIKLKLANVKSRSEVKNVTGISSLAKSHSTYFFKILEEFNENYKDKFSKLEIPQIPKPELKNYVLVIDEINRANLPSVLGELIYALEYRGESVNSMYAIDEDSSIILPENLYIVGTMNTADRSIGHIDYAIRRRFAFEVMLPNQEVVETEKGKELFQKVEKLFDEDNLTLDYKNSKENIQIGHSYFMGDEKDLPIRMKYEIIPIIKEYMKDGIFVEEVREKIEHLEEESNY